MTVGDSTEQDSVTSFYTALMKKMTGQVINGVLTGCLLESELKEVYGEFVRSESNTDDK